MDNILIITYAHYNVVGGIETINNIIAQHFINKKYIVLYVFMYGKHTPNDRYYNVADINTILSKYEKHRITIYTSFNVIPYIKNKKDIRIIGISHGDILFNNSHFIRNHKYYKNIICVNHHTFEKYLKLGIYNVKYLPNNIEHVVIPPTTNKPSDKIKILYYSRSSNDKNLIMLLQAIDDVANKYPNIIMDIYSILDKNHMKYYNLLQNKDKINIHNFNNDITTYTHYDMCVISSVSEGCCLNVLESINYEVPVICTKCVGNNEIINNALPMFNLDDVDVCIRDHYITNYDKLLKSIGYNIINGTLTVPNENEHNYEKYIQNKQEIYNKIIYTIDNLELIKDNTKKLKTHITPKFYNLNNYLQILEKMI